VKGTPSYLLYFLHAVRENRTAKIRMKNFFIGNNFSRT
jgi:hypothetical protein